MVGFRSSTQPAFNAEGYPSGRIVVKYIASFISFLVLFSTACSVTAAAQREAEGIVAFDFPGLQKPKIEVNLDGQLIGLIVLTVNREPEASRLIGMLDAVHVRGYDNDGAPTDDAIQYYGRVLGRRGWETIATIREAQGTVTVHALLGAEAIHGLFVVVIQAEETYFVNIAGDIDPERIGELLAHLDGVGVNPPGLQGPSVRQVRVDSNRFDAAEQAKTSNLELLQEHQTISASNHFVDNEGRPIDEVRVEGNRRVRVSQIKDALEQGPDHIGAAVQTMEAIIPHIRRANWRIHEEANRRIAVITVEEQNIWARRLNAVPFVTTGFNRVHGLRLGPRFEVWSEPGIDTPPRGKLFGELSYGFANQKINYKAGASATWHATSRWDMTTSAQVHRLTGVRDMDVLPNNGEQALTALLYGGDFRDYYLRDGSEISFRWELDDLSHAIGLTFLAEAHESLAKSTDWSLLRWTSEKEANPPITPGQMRSVVLSYDFDSRIQEGSYTRGWRHSFALEHGDSALGSDFDFTRFQAQFRRYQPLGDHAFDARLKIGLSTSDLPIQRQFIIGGPGTLRGYDLYEFAGDQMVLLNLEYRRRVFDEFFGALFFDAGKVWEDLEAFDMTGVKANVGVGVQISDSWRLNWAQALEPGRSARFHMRWAGMF
jgi:hypothetical protein